MRFGVLPVKGSPAATMQGRWRHARIRDETCPVDLHNLPWPSNEAPARAPVQSTSNGPEGILFTATSGAPIRTQCANCSTFKMNETFVNFPNSIKRY